MGEVLKQRYKAVKWSIPEDFLQFTHFERVVDRLEKASSPGYPLMLQFPTNKILFACDEQGNPSVGRLMMVWEMVQRRLVEQDSDPIRLFVKAEPHTKKKLEAGRCRLISSISVVDQIIDAMLFNDMNEKMTTENLSIPPKIGWNPINGGWKIVPPQWVAADKTAWDWTVSGWLVELVLELRASLCETGGERFDRWFELAIWRYNKLFASAEFVSSGGLLFKQQVIGILKSGSVNTISDNSLMQDMLHIRTCLETDQPIGYIFTMGDDTLQEPPVKFEEYFQHLEQYCVLKQVQRKSEFAGHVFGNGKVHPLYFGKHAYTLLHADPKIFPDLARAYPLLYHRSPFRRFVRTACAALGEVPSERYLDLIYDLE